MHGSGAPDTRPSPRTRPESKDKATENGRPSKAGDTRAPSNSASPSSVSPSSPTWSGTRCKSPAIRHSSSLTPHRNVVENPPAGCDTPKDGFQCHANTSHLWGQYSPFFSVPSEIDPAIPPTCELTFAQLLSRHGARDPTTFKSLVYRALVARIQADTTSYAPDYAFLRTYRYTLGADQLTPFGQAHMFRSGLHFHHRYQTLLHDPATPLPFVRASGQTRVIHSAQNWTAGLHAGLASSSPNPPPPLPYPILTIPEGPGINNTLSVKLCPAFLTGPASTVGAAAQAEFLSTFAPPIATRLNAALPGANISEAEVPLLMDLCPYHVVASDSPAAPLPGFCNIFSYSEWQSYDYFQTLGKWFGFGPGNPLGPTQGVGWVNELLARLTDAPVRDGTSTNASLPFPLGRRVYADFGHDNDMVGVLGALGVYDGVGEVGKGGRREPEGMGGFAAAWTVPFAGRVYVEKMRCGGEEGEEEWVRVLVNGRVMGLEGCGGDGWGRCRLGRFVESMKFAREGGEWERCFQ